jgi:hypothetical protein
MAFYKMFRFDENQNELKEYEASLKRKCNQKPKHSLQILDAINDTSFGTICFVFLVFIFLATYLSIFYYVTSEEIYKTICYFLLIPTIIFGIISVFGFYFL